MDKIKFKAKTIDTNEWVFGSAIYGYLENGRVQILNHYDGDFYDVQPETICQYTTLKDKNNTEIYENDVLEDNNGNFLQVLCYKFGFYVIDLEEKITLLGDPIDQKLPMQKVHTSIFPLWHYYYGDENRAYNLKKIYNIFD